VKGALAGKTALVVGGGTGIGRGIALLFAREGCRVAVAGRREEPLLETAALGEEKGPPLLRRAADIADRAAASDLVRWAEEALGRIDILVIAAGINIQRRRMAEIDPAEWDQVLRVNATGAFNAIHAALPAMRARRDGLIINISSIAGKRAGLLGGVAYNASKFAMTALGTSVALEDGKNGIRVTNIYPGEVETPLLERRPVPVSAEHRARILQPEDVAAAALMVACLSPRAHVPELVIKPVTQDYA
jgi:NAD(P)-dependent dehydrogenase (short-subunit alcohol dehydrogenase family)